MNKYDCNEKNIIDNAFVQIKNVHIVVTLLLIDNNILQWVQYFMMEICLKSEWPHQINDLIWLKKNRICCGSLEFTVTKR